MERKGPYSQVLPAVTVVALGTNGRSVSEVPLLGLGAATATQQRAASPPAHRPPRRRAAGGRGG
jgi:hypothetical protein